LKFLADRLELEVEDHGKDWSLRKTAEGSGW